MLAPGILVWGSFPQVLGGLVGFISCTLLSGKENWRIGHRIAVRPVVFMNVSRLCIMMVFWRKNHLYH